MALLGNADSILQPTVPLPDRLNNTIVLTKARDTNRHQTHYTQVWEHSYNKLCGTVQDSKRPAPLKTSQNWKMVYLSSEVADCGAMAGRACDQAAVGGSEAYWGCTYNSHRLHEGKMLV